MKMILRLALYCACLVMSLSQTQAQVVANFTANPTNGTAPLTVFFTNLSSGATDYIWDFGNGNTSTNANPANIYPNPGSYTVTLTAIGPGGSNTFSISNYIGVPPTALFIALNGVASGLAPLTIQFTNLSSGNATSYLWDFGDTNTSTDFSPAHTYTNAGVYTVSLTAFGPGGSNTYSVPDYITVTSPLPPSPTTNVYLSVNFSLSEFIQSAIPIKTNQAIFTVHPGKIGNKEIINSLGLALGRGTNNLKSAKLLLRLSESQTGNSTRFILRQGTNDTDVSQYLILQLPPSSALFGQHNSATTERFNAKAGTTNAIDYGVIQFEFATTLGSFDVQGFLKQARSSLVSKGKVIQSRPVPLSLRAELSGSGFAAGASTVYRGTFTAAGRKFEIKQQ